MTLPNFLVIGTARSGTTSLYGYLQQHPQIYMSPVKEPHYFSFEGDPMDYHGPGDWRRIKAYITDNEAYQRLFDGVTDEIAIGEASPSYIRFPGSAERIRRHIPDVKLVAILRQPVDRAYSQFVINRRDGNEPCSDLREAIREEETGKRDNWLVGDYLKNSRFYKSLRVYHDTFREEQIRVYLYDKFWKSPQDSMNDLFRFLGVSEFSPDMSVRLNVGGVHKSGVVKALITTRNPIRAAAMAVIPKKLLLHAREAVFRRSLVAPPALAPDLRKELTDYFRDDVLNLQDLIRQDLSHWLE